MTDIVERLRGDLMTPYQATLLMDEAAAEIERLRAALNDIRDHSLELYATGVARAALAEEKKG